MSSDDGPEPLRIAVVGGGLAGCACAWRLLSLSSYVREHLGRGVHVTVLERSPFIGGRCAQVNAQAAGLPEDLNVDWGPPMFHIVGSNDFFGFSPHNKRLIPLMNDLFRTGRIERWHGSFGQCSYSEPPRWGARVYSSNFRALDDSPPDLPLRRAIGLLETNPVVSLRKSGIRDQFIRERFTTTPMAALPELVLGRASELGVESSSVLETLCSTKVTDFKRTACGTWELHTEGGASVADNSYDWVVTTSAPFRAATGGGTLGSLAVASKDPTLSARVERIADSLTIESVYIAVVAWKLPDPQLSETGASGRATHPNAALDTALASLYDLTEVVGSDIGDIRGTDQLERPPAHGVPRPRERGPRHPPPPTGPLGSIRVQSRRPPYAIVVLTSTAEFAAQMGTPLTEDLDPAEQECVGLELYVAFENLLRDSFGRIAQRPLPPPEWGPVVHRWAAATTKIESATVAEVDGGQKIEGAVVFPEAGVAVAGDFLTPPASAASAEAAGCIENALGSGLEAAEAILRAALADVEPGDRQTQGNTGSKL